ncbi:glutamate--tRNA ligase [Metamycoplasma hyosynoviae]|uniref:glutamate--tRNA ligase n=1 Tax=Metamycoplasma hyosynoviae TaxID=29559 RepID=UPI00046133C3|nr:glutamate--tRNA ligase [Metamycoplasma hyosynoviae]KDE44897.1 glutamate--tRNA ligase [Metamycoplasma hyosynoviae]MDC8920571.1 glutamate--tRNA ligase [Metamycoplasma hyosynoviae]MDC8921670.1 glutamate--tRNA ligase [Metamycoplasma hyosynoviae]MDC8937177.1 glutamate--tRNA ligase [Metamycoplasma hyosynoviae]MDD1375253.1 glutamate--tRNA ligase [Metamycoplasma hyosynoviae]
MKIRTRYAPSPTGYLHIGGARTALFCYLYAKHFNGDFVFRLEDTDVERNIKDGEKSQLENLKWLGIIPDESPLKPNEKYGKYRQSEKLDVYKNIAEDLIKKNLAYKAYDTSEELNIQREEQESKGITSFRYDKNWLQISNEEKSRRNKNNEYSIRLALKPNQVYEWDDIVRGKISVNSDDIGDFVIVKSDGYPTYNFAVVVDDHQMEITHVLRGEEHITNTPKQLAIYESLNWTPPLFGHLTIITNMEGKKLSKRDINTKQFIEDYRNEGYSPEGIFNFLALLGWTSADAQELMTREELIKKFDPARLSKSPSKFDVVKMEWFSKQHIKSIPNEELLKTLKLKDNEWSQIFIDTYKTHCSTTNQIKEYLKTYTNIKKELDIPFKKNNVVTYFYNELSKKPFTIDKIQESINVVKDALKVKGKDLFMPIRIATTYEEHGPELAKAIYLFGKETIFERLKKWN